MCSARRRARIGSSTGTNAPASSGAPGAKGAHRSLREGNSQRHDRMLLVDFCVDDVVLGCARTSTTDLVVTADEGLPQFVRESCEQAPFGRCCGGERARKPERTLTGLPKIMST